MTLEDSLAPSPHPARDRDLIRIDMSSDRFGIAAALRQAFAAAADDRCDHDFDRLLSELN